jgi:hypothetical protein
MKFGDVFKTILGTTCALAMGGTAHGAEGSITVDNFRLTVVDLDPLDGIAAGYRLGMPSTLVWADVDSPDDGPEDSDFKSFSGWVESQASASLTGGTARAEIGLDSFAVEGSAAPTAGRFFTAQTWRRDPSFTILPNTQLVFTANVSASIEGDPATDRVPTSIFFGLGNSGPEFGFLGRYALELGIDDCASPNVCSRSVSDTLHVSVSTGAESWTGSYEFGLVTANVPAPIPEPQSALLMVVGLGLVGAIARRRRSDNSPPAGSKDPA